MTNARKTNLQVQLGKVVDPIIAANEPLLQVELIQRLEDVNSIRCMHFEN